MKIVEVIPSLGSGGAERFVVDLCNQLANNNEVHLVVLHNFEEYGFFRDEISEKVKVHTMNKKHGLDIKLFFTLRNLIRLISPDVVHTHLRSVVYVSLSFFTIKYVKFIHTVHNDAKAEAGDVLSQFLRYISFRFKRIHPVTISDESQMSFEKFYHLPSTLIRNGCAEYVSPSKKHQSDSLAELISLLHHHDSRIVLNVARLQTQKNQLTLAKAVNSLNSKGFHVELFIIGAYNDSRIFNDIKSLNSDYIHFLGTKKNPRDYMAVSDAFCLSSIFEGMPITLIECFSTGSIPICTPVGGIKNMIRDGVNGILSEGTDQESIEKAIRRFLSLDQSELDKMRKESKESFKRYDMQTCASNYISLMKSL